MLRGIQRYHEKDRSHFEMNKLLRWKHKTDNKGLKSDCMERQWKEREKEDVLESFNKAKGRAEALCEGCLLCSVLPCFVTKES